MFARLIILCAAVIFAGICAPPPAIAAESDLVGTWKLVSAVRKVLTTGETVDLHQSGFIIYGADGHMMTLTIVNGRPHPESVAKTTDQQRAELFRTMISYTGRYTFDGKTVVHDVDMAWNEVWTGTKQVRDVRKDGARLIYSTAPAPAAADGLMGVTTLIWEKLVEFR